MSCDRQIFGTEVLNSVQYLLTRQGQFYFAEIRDGSPTIVMNKEIHLYCCRSLLFELLLVFTCIFGKLDSKIKGGVTYMTSINMKMLFLKLSSVCFIQLHLHWISIKWFQAKLSLYFHHWYLFMPFVFRKYRRICPQMRNKALRLHSWNEMLTYRMSRHVAHSYGMCMGQDCSMIQLGTRDILIEIKSILARNPMFTYITTKTTLKDDKNITFQDKNTILIPGSRMSFSNGVRIIFFFIYLC